VVDTSALDLGHARSVAIAIAEEAGDLLRRRATNNFEVHDKGDQGDLVTELDLASEALIVRRLRTEFPEHRIITEESGELAGAEAWTWLVDPLDGTNNIVIGLTAYAVGLVLCRAGFPVVAVVHDVPAERTWSAARGKGAWGPRDVLLGSPRRGTIAQRLTLGWIQGYEVSRDDAVALALTHRLERSAKRVLRLWAPLLCWTMLARGDIDGIVLYHSNSVDMLAGVLIAREAGIDVRSFKGDLFHDRFTSVEEPRSLVAGHPRVMKGLLQLVREAISDCSTPVQPV